MKKILLIASFIAVFAFASFGVFHTLAVGDTAHVTSESELNDAIASSTITDIVIDNDFSISNKVMVNRTVSIDGNSKTISGNEIVLSANNIIVKNLTTENSVEYGIQAYVATGISLENITTINSSKGGILVNGSEVNISGNTTLTNNAWGGVEVSQGIEVTTTPKLTINGSVNYTHPILDNVVWIDGKQTNDNWVVNANNWDLTEVTSLSLGIPTIIKNQLYFMKSSACISNQAEFDMALLKPYINEINLCADITTNKEIVINRALTLNGHNYTISPNFTRVSGQESALEVAADGVRINELTIDGTSGGGNLHGINVYKANDLQLWRVTLKNNKASGLVVNGSWVKATDLNTSGNGWHGVNIDLGGGVTSPATFVVAGINSHNETNIKSGTGKVIPDLYIDDITKAANADDSNGQYFSIDNYFKANDRAYFLKRSFITSATTSKDSASTSISFKGYIKTNNLNYYYCYLTDNTSSEVGLRDPRCVTFWATSNQIGDISTPVELGSFDTTGLADGNYTINLVWVDKMLTGASTSLSNTTAPTTYPITIDNTAPTTTKINTPTERQWFNNTLILNSWDPITQDVNGNTENINYYQVAYSYDDGHTFGGSTCTDVADISGKVVSGCRDTNTNSRNHIPGNSEQGGVTIWVRGVDDSGNKGAWSKPVHYYFDNTVPTTNINIGTVANGKFTVSGEAQDNLALNRIYLQLTERSTGKRCGGTTINLITSPFSTSTSWSVDYDIATLTETGTTTSCLAGNYAAHVEVVDMAGNRGTAGWTADFMVATSSTPVPPGPVFPLPTPTPSTTSGGGSLLFTPATFTSTPTVTPSTGGQVLGATAYQFTQDMRLGSRGPEVKALQKFLNLKGFTVSETGAGSLGNETEFFGVKTKAALIKYQEANPVILTNVGITNGKGTGNFFFSTRGFVNEYLLTDSAISQELEK